MAYICGPLPLRAARTSQATDGPLAMVGLWHGPAQVLVVHRGKPFCFGQTAAGFYFGSLPEELPGKVAAIPDHYAGVLTCRNSRLWHDACSIGR